MGEANDFENEYGCISWNRSGKIKKQNFSMTVTKQMRQQIKDLGGVVAVKHLIIDAHNKLKERNT
jgi:hypothetical protein